MGSRYKSNFHTSGWIQTREGENREMQFRGIKSIQSENASNWDAAMRDAAAFYDAIDIKERT